MFKCHRFFTTYTPISCQHCILSSLCLMSQNQSWSLLLPGLSRAASILPWCKSFTLTFSGSYFPSWLRACISLQVLIPITAHDASSVSPGMVVSFTEWYTQWSPEGNQVLRQNFLICKTGLIPAIMISQKPSYQRHSLIVKEFLKLYRDGMV